MAVFPQTGTRSAHGSGQNKWWVVFLQPSQTIHPAPNPQGLTNFQVVQAPNAQTASAQLTKQGQIVTSIEGPFSTKADANKAAQGTVTANKKAAQAAENKSFPNPVAWFQQATGGILAGALEQGFIYILKDVWRVIEGPVLILAGALIIIATLAIFFKNDIGAAASVAAMAA
jgi:hypothetical protein